MTEVQLDMKLSGELVGVLDWAENRGFSRAVDWLQLLGFKDAADALVLEWMRRNPPEMAK